MPMMRCPPGAGAWTMDGGPCIDYDGDGLVWVTERHLQDALRQGWESVEDAPVSEQPPTIEAALDELEAGIAAEGESVEALVEEALAQVPEEDAAEVRAEVEAEQPTLLDQQGHLRDEGTQSEESKPREEAHPRGARGDPRHYPTYRGPRR